MNAAMANQTKVMIFQLGGIEASKLAKGITSTAPASIVSLDVGEQTSSVVVFLQPVLKRFHVQNTLCTK